MARRIRIPRLLRHLSTLALALMIGGTAAAYYNQEAGASSYSPSYTAVREYDRSDDYRRRDEVDQIREEIEYARSRLEADRRETDRLRAHARSQEEAEDLRLGFEERRESFERWREGMERRRSKIESGRY